MRQLLFFWLGASLVACGAQPSDDTSTSFGVDVTVVADIVYIIAPTDASDDTAPNAGLDASAVADVALTDADEPLSDVVATDTTAPDATEPVDTTGWVDAGNCGLCPPDRPLCVNGGCLCTLASCGAGTRCEAGECTACNLASACGPSCKNCAADGLICKSDGSACIGCEGALGCNAGEHCVSGVCAACDTPAACGPSCTVCPSGATCEAGKCIECHSATECGAGAKCENNLCVGCSDSDAAHCGPTCSQCGGAIPVCSGGKCLCTDTSCGPGVACLAGKCTSCKVDSACGPSCAPCPSGTHCDGTACVQCEFSGDCPAGNTCDNGACVACGDDPAHCGSACAVCGGTTPSCAGGKCVCAGVSCGAGAKCVGGQCAACNTADSCGPTCSPCLAGAQCSNGACVECLTNVDCGPSAVCESGQCTGCTASDPAHCGSGCAVCSGAAPACNNGACECSGGSCGAGSLCLSGQCAACMTEIACGPSCATCAAPTPLCAGQTTGCVECLSDADCTGGYLCSNHACIPPCIGIEGCATDFTGNANKCSTARLLGRKPLFGSLIVTGDTTSAGNNDDLSTNATACWDAKYDQFYRFWMKAGETVTISTKPGYLDFDLMMKLYAGTSCKSGGSPILCMDDGYDGQTEKIVYTAIADGWYTVVVDGRMAFDSDYDYGSYTMVIALSNNQVPLCCQ